jgi:hypothetical protein
MSHQKELKNFLKSTIIKNSKRIQGKHAPISETINNKSKILMVQSIYDMRRDHKNFFLFDVKNHDKNPKYRYFLAVSLANNSSDLLVQLARDYMIKGERNLIQYSIYPKTLRIQLLLLKEIKNSEEFTNFIEDLSMIRDKFRNKLVRMKNLVENE